MTGRGVGGFDAKRSSDDERCGPRHCKNAKVSRVEPDGIVLLTKSGISKVYFTELPKEVQERFHYDAQQAAQFTSQTVEQNRLARKRKVEENEKRAVVVSVSRTEFPFRLQDRIGPSLGRFFLNCFRIRALQRMPVLSRPKQPQSGPRCPWAINMRIDPTFLVLSSRSF